MSYYEKLTEYINFKCNIYSVPPAEKMDFLNLIKKCDDQVLENLFKSDVMNFLYLNEISN